jgi:DNA repair exonuclease SbcCD nuclease subunit
MAWRFAQFSDAHLGAKLPGLPEETQQVLRAASRDGILTALRLAREADCRVLLIPGDLFDLRGQDPNGQLVWFYEQAADYPNLQVIISPGNADAFSVNCPYSVVRPPGNVYVFVNRDWESIEFDGVQITSRAIYSGEGAVQLDWRGLPAPEPGRLSILMLHATLAGAEDGRERKLPLLQVTTNELLEAHYTYVALGHLHAKMELQRRGGRAVAAYGGPVHVLGFDETGPGGVLIGALHPDGAELAFHNIDQYRWEQRQIELPPIYAESYRERLDAALAAIAAGLESNHLLQLTVSGEIADCRRQELLHVLEQVQAVVFHSDINLQRLRTSPGTDQLELPADSLLAEFLRRCSAEAAQAGSDRNVYELARRFGWQLFTGQGLPTEIG